MIAFTLCSNNYLPMARVWKESLLRHAPDARVAIGLVDEISPHVDYAPLAPAEIIPISKIGIPGFADMVLRYTIVELNTAIKPFLFRHLFNRPGAQAVQTVLYFDPDTKIFSPLTPLLEELETANLLLTPHSLHPVPHDHLPFGEHIFLNYGIYNLGFCGMRRSPETEKVLAWWSARLFASCKDDVRNGFFVDQLWMNLAPLYFEGVAISRHPGLNVAYWNLHERRLERRDGAWFVNGDTPLVFYHFSSFEYHKPDSLGKYSVHYNARNRPEMLPLFDEYRAQLQSFGYPEQRQLPCAYIEQRSLHLRKLRNEYYRKHPLDWLLAGIRRLIPRKLRLQLNNKTRPPWADISDPTSTAESPHPTISL